MIIQWLGPPALVVDGSIPGSRGADAQGGLPRLHNLLRLAGILRPAAHTGFYTPPTSMALVLYRHYFRLLHYTFKSLDFLFPSGIVGKTDDHCVYTMSGSSVCAHEALHGRLGQWVESLQGEGGGGARG